MNLYFSVLGKLVFHFFVIREMYINLRVICEPTTFAGINFHVFGDFSVIKARKLHQTTRCKTCLFDLGQSQTLKAYIFESLANGRSRADNSTKKILPFATQYHPVLPNLKSIFSYEEMAPYSKSTAPKRNISGASRTIISQRKVVKRHLGQSLTLKA